ncbi:MAG: prepilin-type N-terminal cleavage/methylation domain-containing protein [Candidatus Tectomicrobia bacterium]|uniref:Prepilin-type N-terminal cleavage/methylation domain-containing protein n=1 Tax=Tectimicrobiota bacterium TaxID=2528274 RepID=A0A932CLY9_UNCTE|nr:prepilin-type N-terminal cleavage/methylation domain-containing protein [Candidatus Tectomicrobia bacterium]
MWNVRHLKDPRGFTFVELMITMVILVVLAVIAVPLYTGFVDDGRRAEARGAISAILTAEQRYYRDPGNLTPNQYTTVLGDLGLDLIDPQVNWTFTLSSSNPATGFTCRAEGRGTDYTGLWVQLVYTRGVAPVWTP